MEGLIPLLAAVVASQSDASNVAVLAGGGIDSYTVAVACQRCGKRPVLYNYELEGTPSVDRDKVEKLARRHGWPLKLVIVPTSDIAADFYRLIGLWGCQRKTHVEVLFPMMYVLPAIEESVVFTGWNADDHYANTGENRRLLAAPLKSGASIFEVAKLFDQIRRERYAKFDASNSTDSFWLISQVAQACGKQLLDPYTDARIRDFFAL